MKIKKCLLLVVNEKKITVVIKLSFLFLALLTFFSFTGYEEYKYPDKSEQLKIDTLQYVVLKY